MSKIGISIKIDVNKILKERLFRGQKGTYLDLTTFIDLDQQNEYGDNGFISQSVSKDERAQSVQTPILGNVKVFFNDAAQPQQQPQQQQYQPQQQQQPQPQQMAPVDDDIPF